MTKPRIYKGFVLSKDGGMDAPWRAWREDGTKLRGQTLADIKCYVTATLKET